MPITDIVFNEPATFTSFNVAVGPAKDIVYGLNSMSNLVLTGGGPSTPTGGGVGVEIMPGLVVHLKDSLGNTINKPMVVI
jgi:hypothetical protein